MRRLTDRAAAVGAKTSSDEAAPLPQMKSYRESDGQFYFKLEADGATLLQSRGFGSPKDAGRLSAALIDAGDDTALLAPLLRDALPVDHAADAAGVAAALGRLKADKVAREQAKRCRDILSKITQLSASGEPFDRMPLAALMEEVAAPYRNFGVAIDVHMAGDESPEPNVARNPAVLYGLGNLMENAVDFAAEHVTVAASWTEETVGISITDDGPGFAPEIIARVGEPYVTSRPDLDKDDAPSGLGLGFFIAKTPLERSGATLSFSNRKPPEHGAAVFVRWNRSDFERPLGQAAA